MSVGRMYRGDIELRNLVDGIVDFIHEPKTYKWVNRKATEALKAIGIDKIPDEDSVEYQRFIEYQMKYLRDVVIAVLSQGF